MTLAAVAAALIPCTADADEIRYQAVWQEGQATSLTTAPLSRSAFLESGQALAESGLRLIDVETKILNGTRVYAGLWTQGSGNNFFRGPLGAVEMRNAMEEERARGNRLVDVEVFERPQGGRRFLGVWRNGTGEEILTGRLQEDAFIARGETLTAQGLRLMDVEVERINGTLFYTGLFRTGTGSNFFTAPRSRIAFRELRNVMVSNGLELIDVETVRFNGRRNFVGVWASGDGASRISRRRSFGEFFIFAQSQFNDGKRTEDIELAVLVTPDNPDPDPDPGPNPTPVPLPDNPNTVSLVGGNIFTLDFNLNDSGEVGLEIPSALLPDWLPRPDGDILLPDAPCGFNMRNAFNILWQVPGNDAVEQDPFNSTEDEANESLTVDQTLSGVEFGGPVLGCAGQQVNWEFEDVFLDPDPVFEPLPNMRLVIQMEQGENIRFKADGTPNGELLTARQLYTEQTYQALVDVLEGFDPAGPFDPLYCDGQIDAYFVQVCSETPGQCPIDETPSTC
jgi:hypothetical protein